jgi:hypothetical protein
MHIQLLPGRQALQPSSSGAGELSWRLAARPDPGVSFRCSLPASRFPLPGFLVRLRLPRWRDIDRLFRPGRLQRRLLGELQRRGRDIQRVRVIHAPWPEGSHHLVVRKAGLGLQLGFNRRRIMGDDRLYGVMGARTPVLLDLVARIDRGYTAIRAEVSDGREAREGIVSFCSSHPGSILVPDCDFFSTEGYRNLREYAAASPRAWQDRDPTLVWRGSTTGKGQIVSPSMQPDNPDLRLRTRLCLALRGVPGTDVRLAAVVQSKDPAGDRAALEVAGLLGSRVEEATWGARRYALDIDGNSNAWSNLFTRMLLGCCVIKVASPLGFRQWYYDRLHPWEHYVPVAADLSDLLEQIEWCRTHERECAAIAAAGAALAARMTYEGEMAAAAERITALE